MWRSVIPVTDVLYHKYLLPPKRKLKALDLKSHEGMQSTRTKSKTLAE
jgi:hypothetical protein